MSEVTSRLTLQIDTAQVEASLVNLKQLVQDLEPVTIAAIDARLNRIEGMLRRLLADDECHRLV